ncbi:hypothetical protein Tco_0695129 [Tanacetum coccineum]
MESAIATLEGLLFEEDMNSLPGIGVVEGHGVADMIFLEISVVATSSSMAILERCEELEMAQTADPTKAKKGYAAAKAKIAEGLESTKEA